MISDRSQPPRACARCLYTTWHPLGLVLDEHGICSGCRVHEEKHTLDWAARYQQLEKLVEPYRGRDPGNYDCIVPVSGARDSFFIVHTVKKLGLNPLLVTYNKLYNTDRGIRNLARLRTVFDADILTFTANPDSVRKITRATLRRLGSMYWHCLAGQTVFPVQCAVRYKVPLIIWGAHQGLDQTGMFSHLHNVEMTRRYRKDHDLMGLEAEDLISEFDHIFPRDVQPWAYPAYDRLQRLGVRGIYLGNFIPWDTRRQHEQMLAAHGYESAPQTRTFDIYNDVDCFNYSDVHDYFKFLKHGYGKATDHAVRELRWGRLSRAEAAETARDWQTRPPQQLEAFLDWLGVAPSGFQWLADHQRHPAIWRRDANWQWQQRIDLLDLPLEPARQKSAALDSRHDLQHITTANKRPDYTDDRYICIGKGTPCR
jgi:N-acetyl sugar amidotransferase